MEYKIKNENGIMTVKLNGEMDHHAAKSLRTEIDARIDTVFPMILRLDLSGIVFCDSSGLGFIMGRYRKMNSVGGTLVLIKPSPATVKMLSLAGLDKTVGIESDAV